MRKKVIGIIVLCLPFFILTACSGGLSKKSATETTTTTVQEKLVDGTYKMIYKKDADYHFLNLYFIEISGDTLTWKDNTYQIDYSKKLLEGESVDVAFKIVNSDSIKIDGNVYIREGSDSYYSFLGDGAIEDDLEGDYYSFHIEGDSFVLSKNRELVIYNGVMTKFDLRGNEVNYSIDYIEKLFEGESETLSYTLKDDVLTINDNNTYVKAGSDKYKELKEKSNE